MAAKFFKIEREGIKPFLLIITLLIASIGFIYYSQYGLINGREILYQLLFFLIIGIYFKPKLIKVFFYICVITTYLHFTQRYFGGLIRITMGLVLIQLLAYELNYKYERILLNTVCFIVLINIGLAYLQYFNIDPIFKATTKSNEVIEYSKKVVAGFMFNPNHLAALIGISIPCFLRGKWKCLLIVVLPVLFLSNNTICHTRGGLLLVCFCCLFLLFLAFNVKINSFFSFLIVFFLAGNLFFLAKHYGWLGDNGRFALWFTTIKSLSLKDWFLGRGIGSFAIERPAGEGWGQAHNEYLELLFSVGIGGVLVIILYGLRSIIAFFKYSFTWCETMVFLGMCCIAINCLTNFTLHQSTLLIVAIIYIGLWEKILRKKSASNAVNVAI